MVRPCLPVTLALIVLLFVRTARAEDRPFAPLPTYDFPALIELVKRRSPTLQTDLLGIDLARADARQARLLGNPVLDATWGTIPIGETNPAGMSAPLANIPNYNVGISYTFLVGKRGARQERADALTVGAVHSAQASARAQALGLARVFGGLAVVRLRLDGLRGFVEQQRTTLQLAKTRLQGGFGTPLDIDRLEIDLSRVEHQVLAMQAQEEELSASCTMYLGLRCAHVAASDEARVLIDAWVKRALEAGTPVTQRADVRALEAFRKAAQSEAELARAQAIPDVTVRVGYTHDRFVLAGNQQNSLNLTVAVPLPLFERGQAQLQAAEAKVHRFEEQRALLVSTGSAHVAAKRSLLVMHQQRQEAIRKSLPRAQAMLGDLERAASTRLIPLTDVIQARRTLDELVIEEADAYGDAFQTALDLLAEIGNGS